MFKKNIIAVDLGGTHLRVALVKGSKVLNYIKSPTPKTSKELKELMTENISKLMTSRVKGIGVASAGPLINGVIKNPPHLPLKNFDLKNFLKQKFKVRVEVGNDADCVALAESVYGCKKKNFFILTLGTGVGGGIIINRELYTGQGYGGELGHIVIDKGRDLESYWKDYRRFSTKCFGKILTIKELVELKSSKAKGILKRLSYYLGQGIASLCHVLDPEIVILMGGVRDSGKTFLKMVEKSYHKHNIIPKNVPVIWSKIDHPGILGASLLLK